MGSIDTLTLELGDVEPPDGLANSQTELDCTVNAVEGLPLMLNDCGIRLPPPVW